jgi:hypothetical protein
MIRYNTLRTKPDYDEQAAIFKARYGYTLPIEYIQFLKDNGAGPTPKPGYFEGICQIEVIYNLCFDEKREYGTLAHTVYEEYVEEGWLSKNLLPIATADGDHTIFCLILSGPLKGQILWRMDDNILLPDEYDENVFNLPKRRIVIATSMDDFVSKLKMQAI